MLHLIFQGDFGDNCSEGEGRDSEGEGEGLGAAGASSPCSGALSGSVANDRGHLFYLHTKKAFFITGGNPRAVTSGVKGHYIIEGLKISNQR